MQLEPVERVGPTEQYRLDEWFDAAMKDESVRPYLTTGIHTPRLTIPEDDYDGVVLMNRADTGVLKLYTDEESGTMKIGIWVLTPSADGPKRNVTALSLMKTAVAVAKQNPMIRYFGTRVMGTNLHGLNFSDRLFDLWGVEKDAVWDNGRWVNWAHYRTPIDTVATRMENWEFNLNDPSVNKNIMEYSE